MEKILTTLPGNARWLSRWDQGSVLGFHQRYLLLEYSPTWSVMKFSIHEKNNPWILLMIWWLVYCSFSTLIQLLLLVYGQHVNHSVRHRINMFAAAAYFSNMFHFICVTICYVLQQWLICLWTLFTKFYITDTTTQCGNDLLTLIFVCVIKAYSIKASIRNNIQWLICIM